MRVRSRRILFVTLAAVAAGLIAASLVAAALLRADRNAPVPPTTAEYRVTTTSP